ncbi:uncharacterized protein HKW66_Vig0125120 [Vigna angularis]|uniref:Uncharacterized protein n=2 Tax=Phaseolus angularis TaxID=3914 RepID=A0A8T0K3L6_PHAAN|nr:uncharacterized protein HKW66_Vig0125120 [Vigna angularis]
MSAARHDERDEARRARRGMKGLSPLWHIVLPKLGASQNRCMVSEGPSSARNGDISMDLGDASKLIDLLLMNLIADWKPCVAIDHLVSPSNKQTHASQQGELELAKCTGSTKNSTEDLGPSTSSAILATKGNLDNMDINGALSDECSGLQKATMADDHSFEKSYASATTDFNDNKFSTVSFMSAKSEFDGGSKSSPASENWGIV